MTKTVEVTVDIDRVRMHLLAAGYCEEAKEMSDDEAFMLALRTGCIGYNSEINEISNVFVLKQSDPNHNYADKHGEVINPDTIVGAFLTEDKAKEAKGTLEACNEDGVEFHIHPVKIWEAKTLSQELDGEREY